MQIGCLITMSQNIAVEWISHSGGPQFKSRPRILLTWWFSCFSRLSTQTSRKHCKLGHNRLIPHPSQFTVRHSPKLIANHTTDRCITVYMFANPKPNLHTRASIFGCSKLPIQHIRSNKTNAEDGSCVRSTKIRHAAVTRKPLNMINTS
jgi:hypothetical protein